MQLKGDYNLVMKIQYSEEGGIAFFPGLATPKVINLSDLSGEEAEELQRLISEADFWNLPTLIGSVPKQVPDSRQFIITVEDNNRSHTIKIAEPVGDSQISILLETIRKIAGNFRKS
jgi:hypothetical protein